MKALLTTGTAVAATVVVVLAGAAASAHPIAHFSTTKTPYAPQESPRTYQSPPLGYQPIFTETVIRHGSRAMSDRDDGDAVLAVLRNAQTQQTLTDLGARLAPQVRTLLAGAETIGYGNLAGRGRQEQERIAQRMQRRLPTLFTTIAAEREPVEVLTSGVRRATDSAAAFTGALAAADPAVAPLIHAPVIDKDLLYFHKQPQNADYQAYLNSDPQLAATLAEIDDRPQTTAAARHVVSRLFTPGFVNAMTAGDQISFTRSLFELYAVAPDLSVEAPGVNLEPFLPAADAKWFAYLDDAEEFYQSGPAFRGRTITYRMANVLLDDLFARATAKAGGTNHAGAVLRFTHAEEVEPLAVLLGLPGSTRAADPNRPYTYRNNPWRGAEVAPMAANIQWDLYGGHGRYLVRMLYNEKQTGFKPSCRPTNRGSYFYDLTELERCYAQELTNAGRPLSVVALPFG